MSRLIVVSNRVSPPGPEGASSQGGLAMAISAALREYSGIWFGWSGQSTPQYTGQISVQRAGGVTVATMDLEEQDIQEYYNGYANRTLWPLFHYRIDLTQYERSYGSGYARVNARFAEMLMPLIAPDDLIWVQDYHLIPLGRELRERGAKNAIGFFLHIPWPARELMATLPRHRQLVEAMFHYDVIGFHTEEWKNAFISYVLYEAGGMQVSDGSLRAFGRTTLPQAFPIGIDAQGFVALKQSDAGVESYSRVQESKLGRKMLLGVDRLDYSKGIEERFLAFERLLSEHPEMKQEIFLLQISTPTRSEVDAYQDMVTRLDAHSGRINGAFAEMDWIPIRNVHRVHSREELAGIYRAADVALVTPLRDGMNLVAKEFVAAQDEEDPGVLVLSRFAGAAQQMKEALIVNPFSVEDVADAIRKALAMPVEERRNRWRALMDGVEREDILAWRDSFVASLEAARERTAKPPKPARIAAPRREG
ncbi:MAG TPA: alpha,alpha-trehalose-phosphate synthase (UDP-forming) [Vitreimonas sp.]|uniref:alpha,alpha-trehalose-phosphate synthase (UDP-forming) n=1 Tax=Vitreimonas sp. TaxID=3069702 RepID=UPI002D5BB802|nr:alpha,alpha-trehalose-phosphate synthase (UDP-forming) [Vitreimonas sp.]HYD85922.1 alpha,alpha-trehalose-phosphate synthase (UDP-forming) [Vitreimonas sp.]